MKIHLVLTAMGAAVIAADALSQAPAEPPAQTAAPSSMSSAFNTLDANKDGRISEGEAQASPVVSQNFRNADADHDGTITREEFSAAFTLNAPGATPPLPPQGEPQPPR